MYLKRSRRKKRGETCESWPLVEPVHTARGPRQRMVATLGKLPGLDGEVRVGWERIGDILDGRAPMRVGRLMATFPSAARLFEIEISEYPDPGQKGKKRLAINVRRKTELDGWAAGTSHSFIARPAHLVILARPYGALRNGGDPIPRASALRYRWATPDGVSCPVSSGSGSCVVRSGL